MAPIPTESRIFADRCARIVRQLEAIHAGQIAPGARTWGKAIESLYDRMGAVKSPTKMAALMHRAADYLEDVAPEQRSHMMIAHAGGARAAVVVLATFSAGENPLAGTAEDGINITFHRMRIDRHGAGEARCDEPLAYVSRHALARMHQREGVMQEVEAIAALSLIAALGCVGRIGEKHINGELCLALDSTLVVGSLKHAMQQCRDGSCHVGAVYDVRTALPIDEIDGRNARKVAMLDQGRIAFEVVKQWFARPLGNDGDLAERIPYLAAREDYTERAAEAYAAARRQAS